MKLLSTGAIERRAAEDRNLICIKFDGKHSDTHIGKNKVKKLEQITVIREPAPFRYIDHFSPCKGTGLQIGCGVVDTLHDTGSWESIRAIGCGKFHF